MAALTKTFFLSRRSKQNKEVIVVNTKIIIDYLASISKEKSLWNCETLRSGPFCDRVGQIYSKKVREAFCDRVGQIYSKKVREAVISTFASFLFFCYAFERMYTTIMNKTERTEFFNVHVYIHVLDLQCEEDNDEAFGVV